MDRDALLKQVTVLGFMALDLHLYLNTHPDDNEAKQAYNSVLASECKVRSEYEEKYGPLTHGQVTSEDWPWSQCPWPWNESFNYKNNPCIESSGFASGETHHDGLPGVSPGARWKEPYGEELI